MAREKSCHDVVDDFGMGDRTHVPEAGKLHDADPGKRARQQPGNPEWRSGRLRAHHVQNRDVQGTKRLQGRRFGKQGLVLALE